MLKTLRKIVGNNQLLILISVFVILFALFWPRDRSIIGASVAANLGNLRGRVNLEAMTNEYQKKNLVLFYAPWCGHCKRLMPEWDRAAQTNKSDVKMIKVNCDEEEELAKRYEISSYPTILFLPYGLNNPKARVDYTGDRKGEAFLAFIANQ